MAETPESLFKKLDRMKNEGRTDDLYRFSKRMPTVFRIWTEARGETFKYFGETK